MHAVRDAPIEALVQPGAPNISAGALQVGYQHAILAPAVRDAVWPGSQHPKTKQPYGSTTATAVVLTAQGRLLSAEIGNSQFALVRRVGGVYGVVYMSSDHRYAEHPLVNTQIGLQDPLQFFARPPMRPTNCVDVMVQQDDLVVAATDGVWGLYKGTHAERISAFAADVNSAHVSFEKTGRGRCFVDYLGSLLLDKFALKRSDDGTLFVSNIAFVPNAAERAAGSWPLFKSFGDGARAVLEGVGYNVEHTGPNSGVVVSAQKSRYLQDPRGKHKDARAPRRSPAALDHRLDAGVSGGTTGLPSTHRDSMTA